MRAQLQSGEYRRALAFAAHAAGAHLDVIDGTLLYAWLLHVGGQGRYASRLLSEAAVRRPDAVALAQARAALGSDWPRATGALAHGVGRAAPYAWGAEVDATSRVVGTALLLDDGRRAFAPAALIDGARALWLRNGLGQTVRTQVERADGEAVATLRLEAPLAAPGPLVASAREPFAGSPGFLIEYAPGEGPAWPLLRQGFFARPARDGGPRPLDLGVPGSPGGGPVFDAAGRIAGIAVGGHLHPLADQLAAAPPTTARIGVDELYERGLRIALQLIARPRAAVASATSGASAND